MAWLATIRQYVRDLGTLDGRLAWVTKWTAVRSVSNANATKLVIIIPLVGYWIIFNKHLVGLTQLSTILVPDCGAQRVIPWRLFATYFGLCFVAVASFLYQFRCPPETKLYETASQYVGTVSPVISGMELARVEYALQNGDAHSKQAIERLQEVLREQLFPIENLEQIRSEVKRNTLQAHYDLCNRRNAIARLGVVICYTLGFAILAIPSIDIFIKVFEALLRNVL